MGGIREAENSEEMQQFDGLNIIKSLWKEQSISNPAYNSDYPGLYRICTDFADGGRILVLKNEMAFVAYGSNVLEFITKEGAYIYHRNVPEGEYDGCYDSNEMKRILSEYLAAHPDFVSDGLTLYRIKPECKFDDFIGLKSVFITEFRKNIRFLLLDRLMR